MRPGAALVLLLTLAPAAAGAQRLTPSGVPRPVPSMAALRPPTRFVQRMHTYMNWGTLAGAGAGLVLGFVTVPRSETRDIEILWEGVIGASVGNLGGMIVGLAERRSTDTLPATLSDDVLRSPAPFTAAQLEGLSSYAGMGGRIGASVGFLGGALTSSDIPRPLTMITSGLVGFTAGMVVGGVTYAIRRSQ